MKDEVTRVGPFVILKDRWGDRPDDFNFRVLHPSRTHDHGCEGCWSDDDGVGYCEEREWYKKLISRSYEDCIQSLDSAIDFAEALFAALKPPPPDAGDHFI